MCSEKYFEECNVSSNFMQWDGMCVYLQKGLSVEATLQRVDAKSLQHLQVNGTAGPSKRELRREEKKTVAPPNPPLHPCVHRNQIRKLGWLVCAA